MSEIGNTYIPKISVVIPTRNRSDMLSRAIRSVLEQTIKDLEVIVVDDASTQDVEEVVRSFADARLVLVRHAAAKGGGGSRNTGILRARGEFVAFLDDDDEWYPKKLAQQLALFEKNPLIGMVYTGYDIVDQHAGMILKIVLPDRRKKLRDDLLRENVIGTTSTVMVRAKCFAGNVVFNSCLKSCQDWDFYLSLSKYYMIDFVSERLVRHYRHDKRITCNAAAVLEGHKIVFDKISTENRISNLHRSFHHYKLGMLYIQFGDTRNGRRELLKSITIFPFSMGPYVYLIACLLNNHTFRGMSEAKQQIGGYVLRITSHFRCK